MIRLLTSLLLTLSLTSTAQSTFQKLYFTVNNSQSTSIKHTADGGFISSGGGGGGYWVIKGDADGNISWGQNLSNAYRVYSIRQTTDGGYAGCGAGSNGAGKSLAMLFKMDGSGNILWSKLYGDTANSSATDLEQTSDGGYILSGNIGSTSSVQDVYVIKTDALGNLQWGNRYTSSTNIADVTSSVVEFNGAYYISGNTQFSLTSTDGLLIKLNSNGDRIWSYTFDISGNREFANEVCATQDGNLLVVGFDEIVYSNPDATLMKLDTSGTLLWAKAYSTPGPDYGFSLYENPDQTIVFTGASDSTAGVNSSRDVMLIKTNQSGTLLWSRQYGGNGIDQPLHNCLDKSIDGGFLVQATSLNSFSSNPAYSTYAIKTNSNGDAGCNAIPHSFAVTTPAYIRSAYPLSKIAEGAALNISLSPVSFGNDTTLCFSTGISDNLSMSADIMVFPNPAKSIIQVSCTEVIHSAAVYTTDGKQISEEFIFRNTSGTLPVEHLAAGSYLITLQLKDGTVSRLFTKE